MVRISHLGPAFVAIGAFIVSLFALGFDRWYNITVGPKTSLYGFIRTCEYEECFDTRFQSPGNGCDADGDTTKLRAQVSMGLVILGVFLCGASAITSIISAFAVHRLMTQITIGLLVASVSAYLVGGILFYHTLEYYAFCEPVCDFLTRAAAGGATPTPCTAQVGMSFALWGVAVIFLAPAQIGAALLLCLYRKRSPSSKGDGDDNAGGDGGEHGDENDESSSPHQYPVPEGYEFDEETEYYFSEEEDLFFDPATGHFYDPSEESWYDPVNDTWYEE